MGYAMAGWVDFTIELQWVLDDMDDFSWFMQGLVQPPLALYVTEVGGGGQAESLGALLPAEQRTNVNWLRVSAPAGMVAPVLSALQALCEQCFPRERNPG